MLRISIKSDTEAVAQDQGSKSSEGGDGREEEEAPGNTDTVRWRASISDRDSLLLSLFTQLTHKSFCSIGTRICAAVFILVKLTSGL